ncbi:MAG: class I SAM-dependent methyltransferase [Gaiellaceae bacterium]
MTETPAAWDEQWRLTPLDVAAPAKEARTLRWRAQERLVRERFGAFEGLRAIELGAGRGLNGVLFAQRGADVTLLDNLPRALEQARELFAANAVEFQAAEVDLFALPEEFRGAFDVSMSYGLCEHFLGERRLAVVAVHLEVLRAGGLALIGVPNRHGVVYRAWKAVLERRHSWPFGTEEPFTAAELATASRLAGGQPLTPVYGSFAASVVDHGVNQALYKAGRRGLPLPQLRVPGLDRFAYELLLPVVKPG